MAGGVFASWNRLRDAVAGRRSTPRSRIGACSASHDHFDAANNRDRHGRRRGAAQVSAVAIPPRRVDDRRIESWIRVGLVVAAVAPFIGTLFYGFVYDDSVIVLQNRVLVGWKSVVEVWKHPYWGTRGPDTPGLYRPLLMLCFAILANAAHKFAIAYHLFAVGLHATATLLVAKLLRRGVGRWPAAGGALWFALHPVHVEAVANIANSSEVLVCVWTVLLALWLLPARDANEPWLSAPSWKRASVAALLYAAALFSKESGAVAPGLALLVVAGWGSPGRFSWLDLRIRTRAWLRPISLCIVALVVVVVARRLVLGGVTGRNAFDIPGLAELDAPNRIEAVLSTGLRVMRLLIWPVGQTPDYGPNVLSIGIDRTLAATATVLIVLLLLLWSSRLAFRSETRDTRPLTALLWCLLAYLPASNLLAATGAIVAERTLYVASIGVAMLVAWCLERAFALAKAPHDAAGRARARVASVVPVGAAAALVAMCARGFVQTREYALVWHDHHSVFLRMAQMDSLDYRAYQLLAMEAKDERRFDDSARLYARAYALRPYDQTLMTDYAQYLLETNRPRYAAAIGERLERRREAWTDPRAITLYLNATGQTWGPDSVLQAAKRLNARAPSARSALFIGIAYDLEGDSTAAQAAYRDGLRLAPADSALRAHVTRHSGAVTSDK
jgi:protein O-mannosyl-transferase